MLSHGFGLATLQQTRHMWTQPRTTFAAHCQAWCNDLAAAHQARNDAMHQARLSMTSRIREAIHHQRGFVLAIVIVVVVFYLVVVILWIPVPRRHHCRIEPTTGPQPESRSSRTPPGYSPCRGQGKQHCSLLSAGDPTPPDSAPVHSPQPSSAASAASYPFAPAGPAAAASSATAETTATSATFQQCY
eukprot:CAMPEP_0178408594 /NCGR_PEP_ID=MMETSP0689_2-20121128/20023_1 /TAXON_ID=160604 /ORGANISM="Amphidinium massartii, Strain CS-259" /LENGTH=187 /DNA_ID=CAMNT_0020029701 /DNA_START=291 /DNA_END=854 /DNA_ORIENTATION=+